MPSSKNDHVDCITTLTPGSDHQRRLQPAGTGGDPCPSQPNRAWSTHPIGADPARHPRPIYSPSHSHPLTAARMQAQPKPHWMTTRGCTNPVSRRKHKPQSKLLQSVISCLVAAFSRRSRLSSTPPPGCKAPTCLWATWNVCWFHIPSRPQPPLPTPFHLRCACKPAPRQPVLIYSASPTTTPWT